ncbi:hypothetical protein V6N00_16445 [Tersicoccus sp. MR15.9]|uniref:hypothetical protein n=1 Tax=Tersicoccus mangrovi TaxID=3121635 RepID=UPI002FE5174A
MSEHAGRTGTADPRPLIRYAHTPSMVAANGMVEPGAADATRTRVGTTAAAGRPRPRRLWRRLGAAALLTATLATGSALPAQAAASDAARNAASSTSVAHPQVATLTAPIQLVRSSTSLPPRKGRG